MFTLFEIMTTENWANIAHATMDKTPAALGIIITYMLVTTYAMLNVVVAVTVNSTLDSSGRSFCPKTGRRWATRFVNDFRVMCSTTHGGYRPPRCERILSKLVRNAAVCTRISEK